MLALTSSLDCDWTCVDEEVPISRELRRWIHPVVEIAPEILESPGTFQGEDINLHSSNGNRLHIQVKSGFVSGAILVSVMMRFARQFQEHKDNSRFLLIAERGIVSKFDQHSTLLSAATAHKKKVNELRRALTPTLSSEDDWDLFTQSVYFAHGPLFERVYSSLCNLGARYFGEPRSHTYSRNTVSSRIAAFCQRYENWAVTRQGPLRREHVHAFLKPHSFRELGSKYAPDTPVPDHPTLRCLETLLGTELTTLGQDSFLLLLRSIDLKCGSQDVGPSEQHLHEDWFKSHLARLQAASEDVHWSVTDEQLDAFDPAVRRLVALRRLAAALASELDQEHLNLAASSEDFSDARALAYLRLGCETQRINGAIFVQTVKLDGVELHLIKPCQDYLSRIVEMTRPWISHVSVAPTLEAPESLPPWVVGMNASSHVSRVPDFSPAVLTHVLERDISAQLVDLKSLGRSGGEKSKRLAVAQLESLADQAERAGLLILLHAVNEVRAEFLKQLGEETAALTTLLDAVGPRLAIAGADFSVRSALGELVRSKVRIAPEDRDRAVLLRATFAAQRADFRDLRKLIGEVDPERVGPIRAEVTFKVLHCYARAVFIHSDRAQALQDALLLLTRLRSDQLDWTWQTILLIMQIGRYSELKSTIDAVRAIYRQYAPIVQPTELSSRARAAYDNCSAIDAHFEFLYADEGRPLGQAYARWQELNSSIEEATVWATFLIDRVEVGWLRGFLDVESEPLRKAAAEIRQKHRSESWSQYQKALCYLASSNPISALETTYVCLDLALVENDWPTWREARSSLAVLWMQDRRIEAAANAFIEDDVNASEDKWLRRLVQELTDEELDRVVAHSLQSELSEARRGRAWRLLTLLPHRVSVSDRRHIIQRARDSVNTEPALKVQQQEQLQLLKLIGEFFRCPTDEEAIDILNVFIAVFGQHSNHLREATLKYLRVGFYSATGPVLPPALTTQLLNSMAVALTQSQNSEIVALSIDVATAIVRNNPSDCEVSTAARRFIEAHGDEASQKHIDAYSGVPLDAETCQNALTQALDVLARRIQRSGGTVTNALFADNVNDIAPFMSNLSRDQLTTLYKAMLRAGRDPEANHSLRWQVMEFIKHARFQEMKSGLLFAGVDLLFDCLEGNLEGNIFDRSRRENNSSVYSGLSFDPDYENRLQNAALIALGCFQANPKIRDLQRYSSLLRRLCFSGDENTRKNVAISLQAYFQSKGMGHFQLQPVILRLLADSSPVVTAEGISVAADQVALTRECDDAFFSIIEAVYQSAQDLEVRKSLAGLCRKAAASRAQGPAFQQFRGWHRVLRADRSVVVRKYADVNFWRDTKTES